MEACSGAHYWARELTKLGHDARIIWALLMNQTEFKVQPVAV